jgi:hypothetical protein
VALVVTDVSEECNASIIRVTRISKLVTTAFLHSVLQLLDTANVVPSSLGRSLQEPHGITSRKTALVIVLFVVCYVVTLSLGKNGPRHVQPYSLFLVIKRNDLCHSP